MTEPLDLDPIVARFEATVHPGWRDDTDTGQLLAEVRRLRELVRDTVVSLETIHDRLAFEEPDAADALQNVIDRINHADKEV
jgi:hypothetical protein